ncbi:heterokaryon incompatibility protein-domain-containing protein [Boeremia exigua]|uniref:heterokaryon incompatibility protein-domain-containing protein n=1 Tax=Boeremia exigua TaxID=749465 RepID=UPI001E8EA5FA|nr:heterokaryon incompatibility protein-domain-containing protein [Boeremia exigua]KAH6620034.1 heterokaryon incompatibility protein-domain-containing protein [Boeremia exigua]
MDLDSPQQSNDDPEILPDAPGVEPETPRVLHRLLRQPRNGERCFRPFSIDIDLELIQSWRRDCHNSHGSCCNDRYSEALSQHVNELYFVDVIRGCLVLMPSTTPFIALSYVWGDVPVLKTKRQNLKFLQTEGVLHSGAGQSFHSMIPATIRDAMYLVKSLGERYLWVDCLCVVQDAGSAEMNAVLQAMAYIYASAEFTIAVADGHTANHGIRGIGGPSQKRCVQDFPDSAQLRRTYRYPENSRWANRGWTFQESLFSRRLLVFDVVVSWLCGKDARHECFEDPPVTHNDASFPDERLHSGAPMGLMSLLLSVPCLGRWGLLVQDYSRRMLTFEDDTIRAFAGATSIMNSRFPGGILHGLPVFYFDIALLWQPDGPVTRRFGQPSWSWTGWKGSIQCQGRWEPHFAGLYCDTGEPTDWLATAPLRPVATYKCMVPDGIPTLETVGFNDFYKYQALRDDISRPLPTGWTLHHHSQGHFYTKDDVCGGESPYGFPLPDSGSSKLCFAASTSPLLLCTGPVVTVTIGVVFGHSPNARILQTHVYNEYAKAGLIFSGAVNSLSDVEADVECQLVAISEAEINHPNWMARWYWSECGGDDKHAWQVYNTLSPHFYNVLWIQWEDGVAYRKALGMMSKQHFDALRPRILSFSLG